MARPQTYIDAMALDDELRETSTPDRWALEYDAHKRDPGASEERPSFGFYRARKVAKNKAMGLDPRR